jgi:ATP-binding protein involved in chromosome partitioning
MTDPRPAVIDGRLAGFRAIVPVSGGKGGIGKSVVSAGLALSLVKAGFSAALLALDFSSPSQHLILGAGLEAFPEENKGLIPPRIGGLEFMTMAYFSGDRPAPLRGPEYTNALIEMLAVTIWSPADFLVIDMPPGITDAALDTLLLMKRATPILVTTPSLLAFGTLDKLTRIYRELGVGILGMVENMSRGDEASAAEARLKELGLPILCSLPFDPALESALGDPERFGRTAVVKGLGAVADRLGRNARP